MAPRSRTELTKDLSTIQDAVLRMGGLLNGAMQRAMKAIQDLDEEKARQIVADDQHINDLRFEVESIAQASIARQQPAAGDLRRIVAAMNIILDLERMGDHAAGIAKTVLRMREQQSTLEPPPGLMRMYELARSMLTEVLQVYANGDAAQAKSIAAQDDDIDEQYKSLFAELLNAMAEDTDESERALYLLFAGHNLERIADRVTNIAERVVFMQSGEMEELNVESTEPEGV